MNHFKIVIATTSFILLAFSAILFNSCKKKEIKYNDTTLTRPCENVICLNGGNCSDGICQCPKGYEGDKCQYKWNEKFTGNYNAVDDCAISGTPPYQVVITPDINAAFNINLYNIGVICPAKIIKAEVNPEKTSLLVFNQPICGNNWVSGYGNVNGTFINFYLTTRDTVNHTGKVCSIILSKQ